MLSIQRFAETDRGLVRPENEDSFLLYMPEDEDVLRRKGLLAIVADGVGGALGGKQASSTAVEAVKDSYYKSAHTDGSLSLEESLKTANLEIRRAAENDQRFRGMATTCTAIVVRERDCFISHAGDSRAYLFRQGKLRQITEDHTLVNKLFKDGAISAEEARNHPRKNIILKALGSDSEVQPDGYRLYLEEEDCLLLCSDGLYGLVNDDEIADSLSGVSLEEAGRSLINLAKQRGGIDNITVVILRLKPQTPLKDTKPTTAPPPSEAKRTNRNKTLVFISALIFLIIAGILLYLLTQKPGRIFPG
jgi:protein phosphatase